MCEGPVGMMKYLGYGKIIKKKVEMKPKKRLCMLAGGSGITPLYAVALASSLANDGVEIWFLFSNKTKSDILIKDKLDKLAQINKNFHLLYTLTRHDEAKHGKWDGETGRVSYDMLKKHGWPLVPADDLYYASCGPKEFGAAIRDMLASKGFVENEHY